MPRLEITPTLSVDDRAIDERFVRASGPGGQNVNKVETAVQLRFSIADSDLPSDIKGRLRGLAGSKLTLDDALVIDAREHRTQSQNREAARVRLVELLRQASIPPRRRRKTRPSKASKERRLVEKTHRARVKQTRRATDD